MKAYTTVDENYDAEVHTSAGRLARFIVKMRCNWVGHSAGDRTQVDCKTISRLLRSGETIYFWESPEEDTPTQYAQWKYKAKMANI